jgi:transcriptional regulator with XRE-family HTH domain
MAVPRVCNLVNYPEIIKQIRKKKKLTQAKFALRLGINDKTVSAYEKGTIGPSIKIFLTILNVGGYTIQLVEDIYKTPKDLKIPDINSKSLEP